MNPLILYIMDIQKFPFEGCTVQIWHASHAKPCAIGHYLTTLTILPFDKTPLSTAGRSMKLPVAFLHLTGTINL